MKNWSVIFIFFLQKDLDDKLNPISVDLSFQMIDRSAISNQLLPIMDQYIDQDIRELVSIGKTISECSKMRCHMSNQADRIFTKSLN